jgi:hypothetical protein
MPRAQQVTTEWKSEWLTRSGLFILGDVGGDPVNDVILLAAGEFGDAIEDLAHFACRPAISLSRFSLEWLFIIDNQQIFDRGAQGLGHLREHV